MQIRIGIWKIAFLAVALGMAACSQPEPPVVEVIVTAMPIPTIVGTKASGPTAAPVPTATRLPKPTQTPMPSVSVNSDCVGCDVAMPREIAAPSLAMRDYNAPDKVLLVSCSRGYFVGGNLIMGPRQRTGSSEIAVEGMPTRYVGNTSCFAITAVYLGTEVYQRQPSCEGRRENVPRGRPDCPVWAEENRTTRRLS